MSAHPENSIGRAIEEMAANEEENEKARDLANAYLANWHTMDSTEKIDAIGQLRELKDCSYAPGGWLK